VSSLSSALDFAFRRPGWLLPLLVLLGTSCGGEDSHDDDHAAEESAHSEEGTVHLDPAQEENAGIEVQEAGPGMVPVILDLPAVVAPDQDSVYHVNPVAPGVVRSVDKHLGEPVVAGEVLCRIDSVILGERASAYARALALVEAAESSLKQEEELFARRLQVADEVLTRAVAVREGIYERERELQEKAVSTLRPLLEAERDLVESRIQRERDLVDLEAERDVRLLLLRNQLRERRIEAEAAREALWALGVDPSEVERDPVGSALLAGTYEILARGEGIVTARHISLGEYVDEETRLFTVQDLSRVWVLASVYEDQIRQVRTGQVAWVFLNAFPDLPLEGRVALVGYEVDAESRSLSLRLEMLNESVPEWKESYPLRPGMFGRVELQVEERDADVVLPESALVHEEDGDAVFVRIGPGEYELRKVRTGRASAEVVEILEGVAPGEEAVVKGTFTLKSAMRREELGEGHAH